MGSGWHLKNVVIESKISKKKWLCECNKWFDSNEGDGKIERLLLLVEQSIEKSLRRNDDIFDTSLQNEDRMTYFDQIKGMPIVCQTDQSNNNNK